MVSPPHTVIEIEDSPIEQIRHVEILDYADPTLDLQKDLQELAIAVKPEAVQEESKK